jgi:hypothetical protein
VKGSAKFIDSNYPLAGATRAKTDEVQSYFREVRQRTPILEKPNDESLIIVNSSRLTYTARFCHGLLG